MTRFYETGCRDGEMVQDKDGETVSFQQTTYSSTLFIQKLGKSIRIFFKYFFRNYDEIINIFKEENNILKIIFSEKSKFYYLISRLSGTIISEYK